MFYTTLCKLKKSLCHTNTRQKITAKYNTVCTKIIILNG